MHLLHAGCGRKKLSASELFPRIGLSMPADNVRVTHLDADARLEPDIVCTLGRDRIPVPDDSVDVLVLWHVLEHIGQQGQTDEWFHFWEEAYRVLKPGGWLYGESPNYDGIWAWSDPTHSRAVSEHSFVFFGQASYRVPGSSISPYRIRCDFQWMSIPGLPTGRKVFAVPGQPENRALRFSMAAVKPLRPWWEDPAS